MPVDPVSAALGIGGSLLSGILGGSAARKARRRAARERKAMQRKLSFLEANRQEIINPYEGITDLSSMITDYSSQMTNPYANLSVATQAAEMQMEQTDVALANTLDALLASGSGAGGATALARQAAESKKQVAASIEQQEVANERMRAEGQAQLEQRQIAEKQRVEGAKLSQAEKVQQAEAQGKAFVYGEREKREQQKIDRVAAQLDNARMMEAQARADQTSALTGMISGITSSIATAYTSKKR